MALTYISFYDFFSINDLEHIQTAYTDWMKDYPDILGTILIAKEGVNGMLAGDTASINALIAFQKELLNRSVLIKKLPVDIIPFKKRLIKIKYELIPVGDSSIEPAQKTAQYLSPQDLNDWLKAEKDFYLLDTRNDYEVEAGTFKKAIHFNLKHSRDFKKAFQKKFPKTQSKPIVMFCTGGIRCEKASAVALNEGFEDVYQLDGGIINYFTQCGANHYQGNLFVFDERRHVDAETFQAHSEIYS
jgi:UPF0176 protein